MGGGEIAAKCLGVCFQARRGEMYVGVGVCVLWVYIYFVGSLGAAFLVSGILSMYGIFLLRLLIMPHDWELIIG